MNDEQAILELKAGNREAFGHLLKRYEAPMKYMVYLMVQNESVVEDIVMDTFEEAYKKLAMYRPSHKFSTWLFSLARNNTIDYLRTRHRMVAVDMNTERMKNTCSLCLNPEELLIKGQDVGMLVEVMQRLNAYQRDLLELRYFEGLRYKEIAKRYNRNETTIRVEVYRIREKLCKLLTKKRKEK